MGRGRQVGLLQPCSVASVLICFRRDLLCFQVTAPAPFSPEFLEVYVPLLRQPKHYGPLCPQASPQPHDSGRAKASRGWTAQTGRLQGLKGAGAGWLASKGP